MKRKGRGKNMEIKLYKYCDKMMAPMFWKIFIASGNRRSSRIRFTLSYPNNKLCVCVCRTMTKWTMCAWREPLLVNYCLCIVDADCCWDSAAAAMATTVCQTTHVCTYEWSRNAETIQFSNGL